MLNINDFLDYQRYELNRSQQTVESYRKSLQAFGQYFQNLDSELTWEVVDSDVIRDWMESMMDKGNTATTINARLSAVRSFFRFALARGLISVDPAHNIEGPKKARRLPQFLKEQEMDRLIDAPWWTDSYNDVRARTIIICFYETGLRISELIGLNDVDIDFDQGQLKVLGKRNKHRIVPFGDELRQALLRYRDLREKEVPRRQAEAFFVDEKGQRLKDKTLREEVKRELSLVCNLKKRSPHVLRHTFATAMLNHHADLESVKKLLGHASLATTEIYTHTTFEQLKETYHLAHPRA